KFALWQNLARESIYFFASSKESKSFQPSVLPLRSFGCTVKEQFFLWSWKLRLKKSRKTVYPSMIAPPIGIWLLGKYNLSRKRCIPTLSVGRVVTDLFRLVKSGKLGDAH